MPTVPTLQTFADEDSIYASQGGGEPRSSGYWLLWNSCAPDNRSETAAANGGRAAGWYLVDDILADPGLMLGEHPLATCEAALTILEGSAGQGDQASQAINLETGNCVDIPSE